jgi:hypothetical protein
MTPPAFEMADIVRRKGRQFLQRFKAILSYQQAEGVPSDRTLPHRGSWRT